MGKLEVGKWYYFDLMGNKNFLYVYDENEYEYKVEHYFQRKSGEVFADRQKSYINKTSKSLNAYREINKKKLIEEVFI